MTEAPCYITPRAAPRRRERGLTLIELMVGLTVAAVMVTVGVPSYRSLVASQKRVASVNGLVGAFTLARNEAMKGVQHVTVCISRDGDNCARGETDWRHGWIVFANTALPNVATRSADEPMIRAFSPMPGNVTAIQSASLGEATVVSFSPMGAASVSGEIVYCDFRGDAEARAVVLERSGAARVSRTDGDGGALSCG